MLRTLLSVVVLVFAVAACGSDETGGTTTTASSATTGGEATTSTEDLSTPDDDSGNDGFTPSVPLPSDFPVFPGAVLGNDFSSGTGHNYLYNTPGTADEIVEFFAASFRDLGLEVTSEIAVYEEFFVTATLPGSDAPLGIYYLDDGLDDVTPATPGRGYGVNIDLEAWASR